MNKKFVSTCIRIHMSIANFFRGKTKMPKEHLDKFKLPIDEFNTLINQYPYKWDLLHGLIDIVGKPDNFFNEGKKHNRDCDNFANVICVNGILNGYKAYEYIVCDPTSISTLFKHMHVVALLEKDGKFILGNYRLYKGFNSSETALNFMKRFKPYKNNILIVKSREIKLK